MLERKASKRDWDKEAEMLRKQHEINHNKYMISVNQSLDSFGTKIAEIQHTLQQSIDREQSANVGLSVLFDELCADLEKLECELHKRIGSLEKDYRQFKDELIKQFEVVSRNSVPAKEFNEMIMEATRAIDKLAEMHTESIEKFAKEMDQRSAKLMSYCESLVDQSEKKPCPWESDVAELREEMKALKVDVKCAVDGSVKSNKHVFINQKHFEHLDDRLKKLEGK